MCSSDLGSLGVGELEVFGDFGVDQGGEIEFSRLVLPGQGTGHREGEHQDGASQKRAGKPRCLEKQSGSRGQCEESARKPELGRKAAKRWDVHSKLPAGRDKRTVPRGWVASSLSSGGPAASTVGSDCGGSRVYREAE